MKTKTNSKTNTDQPVKETLERDAEVLFQRIFNKWYAFTADGDECYMTEVSADEVTARMAKNQKIAA